MAKDKMLERAMNRLQRHSLLFAKQTAQTLEDHTHRNPTRQVVFVAGVQRSGTNMMIEVLESSLETEVFGESDPRAFERYELKPRAVLHKLVDGSRAPVVVLKALCELNELPQLLEDFKPAKGLWVLRRFEDVVNSHIAKWNGMPSSIASIVQDRNSAGWRGRGMSDATHDIVRKLYHPEISNASACALFWYFRNLSFFDQGLDRDARVMPVKYEPLVTSPAQQLPRIFEFLGIEYSSRVSSKVFSSSISKSSPPEIEPAILEACEALTARFDALVSERI